ncbi:MAG: hypothetical protein JWL64_882 [Frankiales bacterium]|nr:hypothetical protein [Frankiales bacterium]
MGLAERIERLDSREQIQHWYATDIHDRPTSPSEESPSPLP